MKNVFLVRTRMSDQGTEGVLVTEGFQCFTLELPWKENKRNISCIPSGEYIVKIRTSHKYGRIYWITNVKERTWILIHSGNYGADISKINPLTKKNYKSHISGCILVGSKYGFLYNQRAILNSRITLKRFMKFMSNETFKLYIIDGNNKYKTI